MTALDFPASPVDGQVYNNFYYDASVGVWRALTALIATTPAGVISQYAGNTAPSGYLLCEGQTVSRSSYAQLFAAVGTTYNTGGEAGTDFRLPNLKGRVPVGRDSAQTEFDTLGETGGAKTHTLTIAQMPSHTHIQNSHNHTQDSHNHSQNAHSHSLSGNAVSFAGGYGQNTPINGNAVNPSGSTANATTATNNPTTATNQPTTATNQNTGGGEAHNNLQPYVTVNYIIKT